MEAYDFDCSDQMQIIFPVKERSLVSSGGDGVITYSNTRMQNDTR